MFIVVGVVGAVLLVTSLLFGDFLGGLVPELELFSGPAIGAGLAGFGFFGWLLGAVLESPGPLSLLAGIAGGLLLGVAAGRLTGAR